MGWYPKNWRDDCILNRYLYALIDPRPKKEIVYIGHTTNYKKRFREHTFAIDISMPNKYCNWLMDLSRLSLKPKMIILESDEMALYEVIQFESAWLRVAINHAYEIVNSKRDIEKGINTFSGIIQVANERRIPPEFMEDVKKRNEIFFFLPSEYIEGIKGVYTPGIDFSIKRRIEINEVLEELIREYREKDDGLMVDIFTAELEEIKKYYDERKQSKLDNELNKIRQRVKQRMLNREKNK